MVGDKQQIFAVGVNGGATHTQFVVIDNQLSVLARATAGSTNFHNIGFETACEALARGITEAIDRAGVIPSQVAAIGAGLSGVDDPVARARFQEALETAFPAAHILIDHDAMAALVGGAGRSLGLIAISGTGMIVFGIDGQGKRARAGGWGYHLDQGGGYSIAREALTAITRGQDGLGPSTRLTERITSRLGLHSPRDLVDWLYAPERRVDEIAALAADTVALAEDDTVAGGIISQAADALAGGVIAVAQQLDFAGAPFPLLMSGSVFDHSPLLRDLFATAVRSSSPDAVVISAAHDAAVGAALMAFQSLGITLPPAQALMPMPPQRRPTEQRNRLTRDISRRATLDLVLLMNQQDQRVARVIEPELPRIAALIDAIAERFSRGGRLLLAGAGTSGRLAVLDAAECVPTFNTSPDQVIGILAGGPAALIDSIEGAEDSEAEGRSALARLNVAALDSVIGIAASGSTPFVQGVLREATGRGALTGSIANVPHAPISRLAQHPITLVTGPEVIMGSTRLSAGTSQKMVLNMITTGVMVRVGKTYGNLMVDMRASNAKLRERARLMVAEATGLALDRAGDLLARCNDDVKTAIAVTLTEATPDEAHRRLSEVNGNLNALAPAPPSP